MTLCPWSPHLRFTEEKLRPWEGDTRSGGAAERLDAGSRLLVRRGLRVRSCCLSRMGTREPGGADADPHPQQPRASPQRIRVWHAGEAVLLGAWCLGGVLWEWAQGGRGVGALGAAGAAGAPVPAAAWWLLGWPGLLLRDLSGVLKDHPQPL